VIKSRIRSTIDEIRLLIMGSTAGYPQKIVKRRRHGPTGGTLRR
jgi:hypothetical protein